MDSRIGHEKDTALPYSSISYNPYESSSATPISSLTDRRSRNDASSRGSSNQTLDQQHQQNPRHQNHPPPLQQYMNKDSNPDPDPAQAANATISNSTKALAPHPPALAPASNNSTNITSSSVRYRECLKNHAASMGGHVIDGCGEFMPSGEEGTLEALRCAACDCHRNFHRRESDDEQQAGTSRHSLFRAQAPAPPPPLLSMTTITTPHHHHHDHYQHQQQKLSHGCYNSHDLISPTVPVAPVMMAFGGNSGGGGGGGGAAAESSSEDLNMFQYNAGSGSVNKKRFRTKFTQQQKDRMNEFAEKLGWKIQKQDEQQVQQFCSEVGVRRQVFKVWMHNNKQAMKKKIEGLAS